MAHLKRMDHFTRLLGEILICIVPWHPIAWWAKSRLGALSEKACDDWALANGQSPTDYAQLMLTLLPQTRPALALASVTSHRSLKGRIRHILRSTRSDPRLGRGWGWGVTFTAGCLVAAIAFS